MAIQPQDIEEYQKIVMQEPPQKWQSVAAAVDEYFDPELKLAREDLALKRRESNDRKQQAENLLAMQHKKLDADIQSDIRKDNLASKAQDLDVYTSATQGLPFSLSASVAKGMELDDLADINTNLAGRVSEANQAFSNAVSSNDYKEANKIFDENSILFARNNVDFKSKEKQLQGMYAKSILPSLLSIGGVKDLIGEDLYNRWSNPEISNAGALNAFNSFAPTLSIAKSMDEKNITALKTFLQLAPQLYEGAVDANSQTTINKLNEEVPKAINRLTQNVFRTGKGLTPSPAPATKPVFVTAGLDDPKTKKDERVKTALDPAKKYSVEYRDVEGEQKFSTMTGSQIDRMEKREGVQIKSTKEIVQILSGTGVPNIKPGTKVMDLSTNKALTFKGMKEEPRRTGMSIQAGVAGVRSPYGGAKYMYFEDSSGKQIKYTLGEVYKKRFSLDTGNNVRQKKQQDKKQGGINLPMNQVIAQPSIDSTDVNAAFDLIENQNIFPD